MTWWRLSELLPGFSPLWVSAVTPRLFPVSFPEAEEPGSQAARVTPPGAGVAPSSSSPETPGNRPGGRGQLTSACCASVISSMTSCCRKSLFINTTGAEEYESFEPIAGTRPWAVGGIAPETQMGVTWSHSSRLPGSALGVEVCQAQGSRPQAHCPNGRCNGRAPPVPQVTVTAQARCRHCSSG